MSNLYRLDISSTQIAAVFGADKGDDPWSKGYVAPGRPAPVIINTKNGTQQIVPRIWGVPPPASFTKIPDPSDYRPVTHVRNLDSPFWIGSLRNQMRRCLVPATSFQKWSAKPDPATGSKTARWIRVAAHSCFTFAGIWRDSEVASFAILTVAADGEYETGFTSMPMILRPEDTDVWMSAGWATARNLVEPYPARMLESIAI